MAKKTDSKSKPAAPAAQAKSAAPMAPAKPVTVAAPAKPVKPARKPAAVKTKIVTAKAKPAAKRTAPKAPEYTRDDVALRAYFIAEKRQAHGLPGDEHLDWIEAERQLAAESKRPSKAVKA